MADRHFALVTGANRGLGFETCRKLVSLGWRVVVASRNSESGHKAVDALRSPDASFWPLDVSDMASVRSLAEQARAKWPPLDALVNNAAILPDHLDATSARQAIDTNVYGPMRVTDELNERLATPSNVVMVSSGMGELASLQPELRGLFAAESLTRAELLELVERFVRDVERNDARRAGWPSDSYRVSKVALNAFTRIAAKELAPRRIHVNAVCPGWVRTEMGGASAPRSIERGAEGIVWAATLDADGPSGEFFRDGRRIAW
jgi:NAD(P)-dependent dehydrogenase (short-subunit alcohol dehydrogenase family)